MRNLDSTKKYLLVEDDEEYDRFWNRLFAERFVEYISKIHGTEGKSV